MSVAKIPAKTVELYALIAVDDDGARVLATNEFDLLCCDHEDAVRKFPTETWLVVLPIRSVDVDLSLVGCRGLALVEQDYAVALVSCSAANRPSAPEDAPAAYDVAEVYAEGLSRAAAESIAYGLNWHLLQPDSGAEGGEWYVVLDAHVDRCTRAGLLL